jgi:histidinol-phosphate aminotransferase
VSAAGALSTADEVTAILREDLRGGTAYGAPQVDVPVRLNTNENPYPPSAGLIREIGRAAAAAASDLNRYPDRDAVALRSDLAAYLRSATGAGFDLGPDQVWAANGSNEILQQLLMAFGGPGRRALGFEPSYSMHRLIARSTGTTWLSAERDRSAGFRLDPATAADAVAELQPDVVFLCSPNNPTGSSLDFPVLDAVYAAARGLVVLDEAYSEFARSRSMLGALSGRPRLVVTRTMSKAFAFAGARVGYLAADPTIVRGLQLVRLPYHLSALTQAAARAALGRADELLATVDAVKEQRDRMVDELRARGLVVIDSDANFVLFGGFGELGDSATVWRGLLDRGVLVRDVGLDGWLRVTAGTPDEVSAFLTAMDELEETAR